MVATTLLLAFGLAAQVLSSAIPKRDSTERVFLANCVSTYDNSDGTAVIPSSEMLYYSTDAASKNGNPSAVVKLTSNSYVTWEGESISGTFQDGDIFVSYINTGAQNLANFDFAGTGHNNYQNFNCYKDDGRVLTKVESPNGLFNEPCYSIYYCEDVSCFSITLENEKIITDDINRLDCLTRVC
jgi:hypothetical protein